MTRGERVRAALRGEEVDRPPVSVWRHFFDKETSAQGLAEAMLGFQRRFGWDFLKVNPRACYHVQDWGARFEFSPHAEPRLLDWPIKSPGDWGRIGVLSPHRGVLGEMLTALELIGEGLGGEVPFLMTVFTPLSVASRLVESEESMMRHLWASPGAVHGALEAITETFVRFVSEGLARGASGIFLATTWWATYNRLTDSEYDEFGRPYDLRVLRAAREAEFNILHVCRSRNMLRHLSNYPVQAFNWDVKDPTNPTLKEGLGLTGGAVVGGVAQNTTLLRGSPEEVAQEVRGAWGETGGRHFMVGPGCAIPTDTPEENLRALIEAVGALG